MAAFGPAIAAGYESEAEYVDVELKDRIRFDTAATELAPHLRRGYGIVWVKSIPKYFPSLEQSVNLASYEVRSPWLGETRPRWEKFWAEKEFIVVKKKGDGDKAVNARSTVREWRLDGELLRLDIRIGPGRTLKPERIVAAVCGRTEEETRATDSARQFQVIRKRLSFETSKGELIDP